MIDLWIEITIGVLGLWAVWKTLPKDPELDWKYYHSLLLVTELRRGLDDQETSAKEWLQKIRDLVPYNPNYQGMDSLFEEGDRSLPERWQLLFQEKNIIEEYLMCDPGELGSSFSPGSVVSWQDIIDNQDAVQAFLQRKLKHAIVVGQGSVAANLSEVLGVSLFSKNLDIEELSTILQGRSQRFIFCGVGEEVQQMLTFAHQYPALRDRILGMILIDPQLDSEWLDSNFTHEQMDAEANHAIPYILWSHVDLADLRPWQSLPEPPESPSGWRSIELIDLGAFPIQIKEYQKWMNQAACFVLVKRMELT